MMGSENVVKIAPPDASDNTDLNTAQLAKLSKSAQRRFLKPLSDPLEVKQKEKADRTVYRTRLLGVFERRGDTYRLKSRVTERNTHALMAQYAADGHKFGIARGTSEFRRMCWMYGSLFGCEIQGYKPDAQDKALLDWLKTKAKEEKLGHENAGPQIQVLPDSDRDEGKEPTSPSKPPKAPEPSKKPTQKTGSDDRSKDKQKARRRRLGRGR